MDDGDGGFPRRFGLALAAVPLIAVMLADATVVLHRVGHDEPVPSVAARPGTRSAPVTAGTAAPAAAIRDLLSRRGDAVVHHDRAEWLSTVDPDSPRFRHAQARAFFNLRHVPIGSWGYTFDPTLAQHLYANTRRYHTQVWAPATFALHYRIRGFDTRPTDLVQYPTFVRRGSHWYLASLSDFAPDQMISSRDVWDFGPVVAVRRRRVLVLGHPGSGSTLREVADEVSADIPRVSAVWGNHWPRRIVVLVPKTQKELGAVVDDTGDLDHIAAVATAEVQVDTGRPDPVGERIGINPRNWPSLTDLGRRIVLTHELTHIATRGWTGAGTPTWLAEGFADYVGYLGTGIPTSFAALELARDVRAGRIPTSLPSDLQFDGANRRLPQAYEEAWLACRMIAAHWGQPALVHFYRVVGRWPRQESVAVSVGFSRALHTTRSRFVSAWRSYVRAQLG